MATADLSSPRREAARIATIVLLGSSQGATRFPEYSQELVFPNLLIKCTLLGDDPVAKSQMEFYKMFSKFLR